MISQFLIYDLSDQWKPLLFYNNFWKEIEERIKELGILDAESLGMFLLTSILTLNLISLCSIFLYSIFYQQWINRS